MTIVIKNFGPISEFKYDLSKSIIVTYGDNNIGKSYAMQVVYLLLKNFRAFAPSGSFLYFNQIRTTWSDDVQTVVKKFAEGKQKEVEITKSINNCLLASVKESIFAAFMDSCENTFGHFKGILSQKPQVIIKFSNYEIIFSLSENHPVQSSLYQYQTFLKKANSDFHRSRKANGRLDVYYYDNIETSVQTIVDIIVEHLTGFFNILKWEISNVYFFPASRSGIYTSMSAFSAIVAELAKSKARLTKKIELPGISEPVSDYFLMLSSIDVQGDAKFESICKTIETDILKGKVSIRKKDNSLVYTPDGIGHEFEMTEVSSMVSEISPIVAFFKYIARAKPAKLKIGAQPIVFIEEPEAHLHPNNQVKLIEMFSELHKWGIKIVISSHSNYIFNKLNNLLLEKKLTPEIYSPILLKATDNGSVSELMEIDEYGADDINFLDVSLQLYNEREELIKKLSE